MQQQTDPEAIADDLYDRPREILRVFEQANEDGEVNTHDITTETGFVNQTVGHHIRQTLINGGLVESTGEFDESENTPNPPKIYRLTDMGAKVLNVYRQREAKTEADISKIDELEQTVARLEKEIETLRDRQTETEQQVGLNKEGISAIKKRLP